jgi:hypothetical protein
MSELPPPDLMDSAGRMRRIVIALLLGGAAAAAGYFVADSLAKPDEMIAAGKTAGSVARASQFVFYVAGLAGAIVFLAALTIQNKLADKKYRESLGPPRAEAREKREL